MNGSEENNAGASDPLQDNEDDVNSNDPHHEQSAPATPETTTAAVIPTVPTAPLADLNVSVGDTAKKLFSQLNELKTAFIDASNQLCNSYNKTAINDISFEVIKKSNKLQKKDLGIM